MTSTAPETRRWVTRRIGTAGGTLAFAALLLAELPGCRRSCPAGATLHGGPPPKASEQWCERGDATIRHVPVAGRTYEAAIGIDKPTARGRQLMGPAIGWYPDGHILYHGRFAVSPSGASVPDGMWSSWHPGGQRESQGRYAMGTPVGCFAKWSESGILHTFVFRDGAFRPSPCKVILDNEATRLAARYNGRPASGRAPAMFSAAISTLLTLSDFPLGAKELMQPDESIENNARIAFRRRVRWFKLGLDTGFRSTGANNVWSASLGASGSLAIPTGQRWLDAEVTTGLGARLYSTGPVRFGQFVHPSERFPVAYAGAQAAVGVLPIKNVGVYVAFMAERDLRRTIDKHYEFCRTPCFLCAPICTPLDADWDVGGTTYGVAIELRVLIR